MTSTFRQSRGSLLSIFAWLFVISVVVNYFWEVGQGFLFEGMSSWESIWWHCFVASLGDGIILWIIYAVGWAIFKRADWFVDPGKGGYGAMLLSGLILAAVIEWGAVHVLQRWSYTNAMPLIPGLDIGITPIMQMLVLPPIIFYIVALRFKRIGIKSRSSSS